MIRKSYELFLLREVPFSSIDYPRWQSVLAITGIGLLSGLDPSLRSDPYLSALPTWLTLCTAMLATWSAFIVVLVTLRWSMLRGERWNGRGDLFNLLAASWLITDFLGCVLIALDVPQLLTLPLFFYAIWVGAKALSGAIPKASLSYSICSIVISLVPAILAAGAVFVVLAIMLNASGLAPILPTA